MCGNNIKLKDTKEHSLYVRNKEREREREKERERENVCKREVH